MKTIYELNPSSTEVNGVEYKYQENLTKKLDANTASFTLETINEIVLWKTNRYAEMEAETLDVINGIDTNTMTMDEEKPG